jgi:hypothetical protein
MVRKNNLPLVFIIIIILFSCDNKKRNKITAPYQEANICFNWILQNSELKKQIIKYYETVEPIKSNEKILRVYCTFKDGIRKYYLEYFLGAYSLFHNPVHLFLRFDDKLIAFTFSDVDDFCLDESSLEKIMKEKFPRSYKYYMEEKRLLTTSDSTSAKASIEEGLFSVPVTGGSDVWELTFKDGKMIDKKIER